MLIKLRIWRRNLASLYAIVFEADRVGLRGRKPPNQ